METFDNCFVCGQPKDQVPKLIIGRHGAICSHCIAFCYDLLVKEGFDMSEYRKGKVPAGTTPSVKADPGTQDPEKK